MPQSPLDPSKLALIAQLLGQDDPSVTATGNPQPWDAPSPRIQGAVPGDINLPPSTSVRGAVPGDINLPRDPTPLDTNRLPEVNTQRMGQSASDQIPAKPQMSSGPPPPLDSNRLPATGGPVGHPPTGAAHPPVASGADALATFLGGASGPDPSLELGRLRNTLKDEYETRLGNSRGAGDAKEVARVSMFLKSLNDEIDNDPFTGKAAQATAQQGAADYHKASQLNDPSSPEARNVATRDAVALQKSMVEHPNPNVSPFADGGNAAIPNVPGAVPNGVNAGRNPADGHAPQITGGDMETRIAQGTADLRPEDAATVRALLEYRANIPSGNVLARPEWSTIVGRARMIDPTFDTTQWDARKKLRESMTSGEAGQRVRSLNALSGHVTQLDKDREALGNFNFGAFANPAVNWIEREILGNGNKFSAFDTTNGLVNAESGKFLGGANATNELRNSVGAGITSDSSDSAISGHIDALSKLSKEQYDALVAQAGGVPYLQGLIEKQITPGTTAFLNRGKGGKGRPGVKSIQQVSR